LSFIDYLDRRPIYEQIVEHYRQLILTGALECGEALPSVRKMAADLSINPNTIQKAYLILEKTGYIYAVRGRGNFVADISTIVEDQKEACRKNLEKTLAFAADMGVGKEECQEILERVYKGKSLSKGELADD
jgi:GntR family transcriptional regulator